MQLTVVGCSGSTSGPDSPASCYLIQAPHRGRTFSLVLDLGPGAFGALHRYVDPRTIGAYALTHLHPDHCLDLCAAYVAARYSPTAPWPAAPVYAPSGAAERIRRAYDVPGTTAEEPTIADWFDYRDWRPTQTVGPFEISTAPVEHPVPAYALRVVERVPDGGSLVYSGDTGPCDALVDLAAGADLLLIESAFLDGPDLPPGLHLSGAQAAQTGARARVHAVLLTHIPPWHDRSVVLAEAVPHFDGPVVLAAAGATWTIG